MHIQYIGMAGNWSECAIPDAQIRIINLIYISLSLFSFVIGVMALLLNRCYYCRHKDRHLTDPTEEIFFAVMVICCTFEFSDCFQWFVLLDDFVALCKKPSIRYCIFLRIFCVYHQYTKVSAYFKYPLVYFMNPRATIIHSAYS